MKEKNRMIEIQEIEKKLELIVNSLEQDVKELKRNNLRKELLLEELLKIANV